MALSIYSNWATPESNTNLDMSPFLEPPSEIAAALAGFCDPFDTSHFLIDSLFDQPSEFVYIEPDCKPHCSLSDPSLVSLPRDNELGFYQCPKRQRGCSNMYCPPEAITYFDGPIAPPAVMSSSYLASPQVASFSECNDGGKKVGGGCLSAQSVAARERRKRISDKTQELGRLIPGGNKMNTAEMFHAAYKYVKFLQAQVGILGLVGTIQGNKGSPMVMQGLVSSPIIQEKLYSEGKCIVPKGVVEGLAEDQGIKSNHFISKELDLFIESMGLWDGSFCVQECLLDYQ